MGRENRTSQAQLEMVSQFTPPQPLKTAVLFLIFNRLDTTKQVFEEIRRAKPSRLYIAADGPRDSRPGEDAKVAAVRDYVICHIDWDCEIVTLFREKNLGCRKAVSSAIDWFFAHVEEGIILEDDCLPSQSFFGYCQELLEYYRHDTRIMQICGLNVLKEWSRCGHSYYFSNYGPIWGWASWRRAWQYYDVDMKLWPEICEKKLLEDFCQNPDEVGFRLNIYNNVYSGNIDTWDYQWGFAKMINSGLSIIPAHNLISNIGFGIYATHTTSDSILSNLEVSELDLPLIHPQHMIRDKEYDKEYNKTYLPIKEKSIWGHIRNRLKKR